MSALQGHGEPGDRVLRNVSGTPVLAEITLGIWMPVMPCMSWEDWRQLAWDIREMDEPAMPGAVAR